MLAYTCINVLLTHEHTPIIIGEQFSFECVRIGLEGVDEAFCRQEHHHYVCLFTSTPIHIHMSMHTHIHTFGQLPQSALAARVCTRKHTHTQTHIAVQPARASNNDHRNTRTCSLSRSPACGRTERMNVLLMHTHMYTLHTESGKGRGEGRGTKAQIQTQAQAQTRAHTRTRPQTHKHTSSKTHAPI